jgi:hypothetical protein
MARQLCVYVDLDDTSFAALKLNAFRYLRWSSTFADSTPTVRCWSSGGADCARTTAEELNIASCFAAFLPKPQVIIDDQLIAEWPQFLHVHPSSCRTLDEYLITLAGSI